ncbi:DNA topoisomerase III [Escherichia coli]|nr:DNA topoisomerase III [Escherichia coli]EKM7581797.1 DNA topoisomerase III [Escherichia coli]
MQYALFDGFERKFLLDALELGVLKDWKEYPVKELPDIDESAHPFYVCYGGYLLNSGVSDSDISRKIKDQTGFWLAAIDDTHMDCHSIAYYDIHTLPLISCGRQKIVPFAALIKADRCIISKIASYSGFAVTAFLRIKEWDIATNIFNREGIFAFNGCEHRLRQPVGEDNWKQAISEERAIRYANRLIQCEG